MADKIIIKNPRGARFMLPMYYHYIENDLRKECEKSGSNYDEESKKVIEAAMIIGDAYWDQLQLGLKLLNERFGKKNNSQSSS